MWREMDGRERASERERERERERVVTKFGCIPSLESEL